MRVFGHGFDGDAADFIERFATEDGAGATEEGGIPEVVAVLNDAIEELVLVGNDMKLAQIALEWVR